MTTPLIASRRHPDGVIPLTPLSCPPLDDTPLDDTPLDDTPLDDTPFDDKGVDHLLERGDDQLPSQ